MCYSCSCVCVAACPGVLLEMKFSFNVLTSIVMHRVLDHESGQQHTHHTS